MYHNHGTTGCGACNNITCSTHGCQRYRYQQPYIQPAFHYSHVVPLGCICPPTENHGQDATPSEVSSQWRPIEEAPIEVEDGRDVLLLTMDGPLIAFWEKGRWLDKDGQLVNFITHWMPIPPPPAGEPSDE